MPQPAAIDISVGIAPRVSVGVKRLGAALRATGQHVADPLRRPRHVDVHVTPEQVDVERAEQDEDPAEDVVQDAFLCWNSADRASVAEPRAFLARTASRLCLDRMKSARAQRERYVGTWLPEPWSRSRAGPDA